MGDLQDDLPISRLKYNALDDFLTGLTGSRLTESSPISLPFIIDLSVLIFNQMVFIFYSFKGFSDLEDFWDDLTVSRLKYNAIDGFQEVFHTTSWKPQNFVVSEIQAGVCEILSVGLIGEERDESETRDRFTVKGAGNMTRVLLVPEDDIQEVGEGVSALFPYNIEIRLLEDESQLLSWKNRLEDDMKMVQFQDNKNQSIPHEPQNHCIFSHKSDTIDRMKEHVEEKEGIPPVQQRSLELFPVYSKLNLQNIFSCLS
ncbi:hypothetical protein YC2023_018873 [Brassica napus]